LGELYLSVSSVFKFIGFISVMKVVSVIITLNEYAKEHEEFV
jgi:hypothetical protein